MRRIGLLAGVLLMVSLTTAMAASFEVNAEDVMSFTTPVSISVPPPPTTTDVYYLTGSSASLPGLLSTLPASSGQGVESKDINADPSTAIDAHMDPTKFHDWETAPLTAPLTIISPTVRLYIEQTGNVGPLTAGLFECITTKDSAGVITGRVCDAFATASSTATKPGEITVVFAPFTRTIVASTTNPTVERTLLLRVVNRATSGKWNIQWGYKENRPAQLQFSTPS